jgi:hypothetical protein
VRIHSAVQGTRIVSFIYFFIFNTYQLPECAWNVWYLQLAGVIARCPHLKHVVVMTPPEDKESEKQIEVESFLHAAGARVQVHDFAAIQAKVPPSTLKYNNYNNRQYLIYK